MLEYFQCYSHFTSCDHFSCSVGGEETPRVGHLFSVNADSQHQDPLGGGRKTAFKKNICDIIDITLGQFKVYSTVV